MIFSYFIAQRHKQLLLPILLKFEGSGPNISKLNWYILLLMYVDEMNPPQNNFIMYGVCLPNQKMDLCTANVEIVSFSTSKRNKNS